MKTIIKTLICCTLFFAPIAKLKAQDQSGDIKVTVVDEKNQPMVGALVQIVAGGPRMGGATDTNGIFVFRSLSPGSYDVQAQMTSYKKYVKTGIPVSAGQTSYANFPMEIIECDTCPDVVVIVAKVSPVDPTFSTVESINAYQIKHMAVDRGNVVDMVTGSNSQVSEGKGGQLVMRGAREGASNIYIDGDQMYGTTGVCGGAIEQVSVLSGGIPASYGDLTGGAVIITTKSFYNGTAEKENMYQETADAKEKAAKEKAAKANGTQTSGNQIIEKQNAPAVDST